MTYDYAVIGAGVSGMSAALILARNGARVALLEKSAQIAPLLRGFSRGGVRFDTGFHCTGSLGDGEILSAFLRYLGLADKIAKEPFRPDGFDCFRCQEPDWEFNFPYGWERLAAALCGAFPTERVAINEYLRTIRESYEVLPYIDTQGDVSLGQLLPDPLDLSLSDYLDRLTADPMLKTVLSYHWFLGGVPPEEAPLSYYARVVASHYGSVHGLRGGGRSLVEAFAVQLGAVGVDVFCGSGVTRIEFSAAGAVSGVRTEAGAVVECRACVATVHPRYLADMVPEPLLRAAYRTRLKTQAETLSAFIVYALCDATPGELRGRNLVLVPSPEPVSVRDGTPVRNLLLYVAGVAPGCDAPNGKGGFVAICPASWAEVSRWANSTTGRRPPEYVALKEQVMKDIRARLGAACPRIAARITDMEVATPLTISDRVYTPVGSLYGIKRRLGDHVLGPRTRAEGLYLAGQSIVAPGIAGAMVSSFITCGTILGHRRIREGLQACR